LQTVKAPETNLWIAMNEIIDSLREELISNADEKVKVSGERFFREEVRMYCLCYKDWKGAL
jgi:hypothetical protein